MFVSSYSLFSMSSNFPHDSLFKDTFSQLEHAQGLIRSVLPKELVERMDFSTLQLQPGSYLDEELKPSQSDLLFSIVLSGQRVLIYLLVEHQSSVDDLMPFRLLRYMVRIWEDHFNTHPNAKSLPVILPIVFYHGDHDWNGPTSMQQLYDIDVATWSGIAKYVPQFSFLLDDVTHLPNEWLQQRPMSAVSKLVVLVLRDARFVQDLPSFLRQWHEFIDSLEWTWSERELVKKVIQYILQIMERLGADTVLEAIQQEILTAPKEVVMSAAEELIQRGFQRGIQEGERVGEQRGRQEGLVEGKRSTLSKMLQLKFRTIPTSVTAHIAHGSLEQLDRWIERIFTASSVHDVFAEE